MRLTLVLYQHSIDIQINMTENKDKRLQKFEIEYSRM